jgi:PAS domain S-box-containing protein
MVTACLLVWPASRALALEPARDLTQYNCQTWGRQNGLLVNGVNAIAQTDDGYLWLGTSAGLIRFDGIGFTTMHFGRRNRPVTSLASGPRGGLWVGWERRDLSFYDGQNAPVRGNLPAPTADSSYLALQEDPVGAGWIVGNHQLGCLTPAGHYELLAALPGVDVNCGFRDSRGRFWYGMADNGVYYWQAGALHQLDAAAMGDKSPLAITEDHEGNIWIGTTVGLFAYDASLRPKTIPALWSEVRALLVDRQGILWIGTSQQGLVRYHDGQYAFLRKADGLASDYINALAEDQEGSLWIGTRHGLSQLTDVKFPTYLPSDRPNIEDAFSVCASRQGGVWVGSLAGLTYLDGEGRPKTYGLEAGLPNLAVKREFETRTGDVYLACGRNKLAIFSGGKVIAAHTATNMVVGMAEDDHGVVVSVGGSLFHAGQNYLTPYVFTNNLAPAFYWVLNLAPGRDGVIWVASANGMARVKDGVYQQWTMAQGLTDNRIGWICEDSEGVVWAAMSTGIARLKDNQIRCISEENGLFDNHVLAIVPDDLGNLWVDSGSGIFRVARQSLNDFADGKATAVACTPFNGLASVHPADKTFQEQVGGKTADGRIWFPNANGVVVIDPRHISANQVPPPVHLQGLRANGREYPLTTSLVVPPGNGELQFDFAALSFIAPQQVHYRYQLAGYDAEWVDAGTRRLAFYTNLKPGRYTFHVIAANADGIWNPLGDAIAIKLLPHFYQAAWFYTLCVALLAAAMVWGYRRNLHRAARKERALHEGQRHLEQQVNQRTAELAYERDLLRTLLDNAPDHIYFKDTQSRFVKSGTSLARRFGVASPEELMGKSDFDFFTGEHARPAFADEQAIIRTGQPMISKIEKEVWQDRRPNTWMLSTKMPWRNQAGTIIGTFGISKDISALKETETALAYERDLLKTLLDNSPDSIYFKDRQSRFVRVSKSKVQRNFAFCREKHQVLPGAENLPVHLTCLVEFAKFIVGKTDFDIFPPENAEAMFAEEQEIIRTGVPVIGELAQFTRWDGTVTWTIETKMLWRGKDGEILGTFGTTKDVTFIKKAEAEVESAHKRLVEISRQAGMAEVATNVLHNVGNVLNSVNVSAALVADNARKSTISYVAKVAALLEENAADLGGFMTSNLKGRQLPAFLSQLAGELAAEQQQAVVELELLRRNIEHIKEIVAMQQSYARISGVTETVPLRDLVEDALAMNAGALSRHEIELVRHYADVPPVTVEKHKVLQILVNIIRNAKYACDEANRSDKKITLTITKSEQGAHIAVSDNGIGIPPENLPLIFNHGFTTRPGGHGFGLHSGGLAARELGGSLTVHSDGRGKGATFTLILPFHPPITNP